MRTIEPYQLIYPKTKQSDTDTIWKLRLMDDGSQRALDSTMTAIAHISNNGSFMFDVNLGIKENLVELDFNDNNIKSLPAGNYGLEIELKSSNELIAKYPSDANFNFELSKDSVSAIGGLLPTVSVQAILNSIDEKVAEVAGNMEKGDTGKSAYDIWQEAGNVGTVQDFVASLQGQAGDNGISMHLAWAKTDDGSQGFTNNEAEAKGLPYIGYSMSQSIEAPADPNDYIWTSVFNRDDLLKNIYYQGIETTKYYDDISKTVYYLTRTPAVDSSGQRIELRHGFAYGVPNHGKGWQTPASFLADHPTATLISNAAPSSIGNIIQDGKIISSTADGLIDQATLAVKANGTLTWYPTTTTSEEMIEDGVVNSWTGFWPIIVDGKAFDVASVADVVKNPGNDWDYQKQAHPREIIAQLADKSLLFMTVEGRLANNIGMTIDDLCRILLPLDVVFAYNFDAGGSAALINKGVRINAPYDDNFTSERAVSDFIYIDRVNGTEPVDPQQQVKYQNNLKSLATYNVLAHQLLDLEHNSDFGASAKGSE